MAIYDIVEGTSSDLDFQLLEAGAAINLTGITVALLVDNRTGAAVSLGTVSIISAVDGTVRLTPTGTSVFVASTGPYYARWKLTDGFGKVGYVPSSNRDTWNIVGQ